MEPNCKVLPLLYYSYTYFLVIQNYFCQKDKYIVINSRVVLIVSDNTVTNLYKCIIDGFK